MKLSTSISAFLFAFVLHAQTEILGAWEHLTTNEQGEKIRAVAIVVPGYQVATWYKADTGEFITTNGGKWRLDGNTLIETVEFHTDDKTKIGQEIRAQIKWSKNELTFIESGKTWKRIDDGKPGALQGAWLFSARLGDDGKISERNTDQPRKTMKVLSGTRFQWIAYHTETGEFFGTGGGRYTTEKGQYTEHIEFFSRDITRVGAALSFAFELKDGKWHHSGKNSKGEDLYEVWAMRVK
jgi:hypothetical protein